MCPSKERLPCVPPGPRIRFSAAWCSMSRGDSCEHCGATLHICDHRFHRIHTLQGPVELLCRLAHCSDCLCPLRCQTLSPAAELSLTLPWWTIRLGVFCWMLVCTCRPDRVFVRIESSQSR